MPLLPFISDQDLKNIVDDLLICAQDALDDVKSNFTKNVIDPFCALFEMAGFNIDQTTWRSNEKMRKAQKTLSNHIGLFHQKILGKTEGWEDLGQGRGIDLVSEKEKVIAEIKNKYSTVPGGKLTHLYTELNDLVMPKISPYKGYKAYYVYIIPQNPRLSGDLPFTPPISSKGTKQPKNPLIRKIDGYSFYQMVTGVNDALLQLFRALPQVIVTMTNVK